MINLLLVGLATGGFWNVRAFVVCISVRNMTYCRQAIATISEQLDMYRPRRGEILYEGATCRALKIAVFGMNGIGAYAPFSCAVTTPDFVVMGYGTDSRGYLSGYHA